MSKSKLKKRFLTLFLAVAMVVTSVNLTPFGTVTAQAAESTALKAGDYYIMNVATGGFLNGGNSWGTQASALRYGQLMTVNAVNIVSPEEGMGIYTIDCHFKGNNDSLHFLHAGTSNDGFVDQGATDLTITKCADGSFTIVGDGRYLTASDANTVVTFTTQNVEFSQWRFISRAELIEEALENATEEKPADVTSLILDSGFGRNNKYFGNWKVTGSGYKDYKKDGENGNQNVQFYGGVTDVYQEIQNVPNGVYGLNVQGFYREDGTGTTAPAVYYINEVQGELKTIDEDANTGKDDANGWTKERPENSGKYVPNGPADATKCFDKGAYINKVIKVTVTNHKLRVGVKATDGTKWVCWDDFALTLINADAEFAERVEKKIDAIGDIEVTEECNNRIKEAEAAYEALTEAGKALVAADKVTALQAARAEFDELFNQAGGDLDKLAADSVIAKIDAIGEVQLTDTCKANIEEARAAYEALTEAGKAFVAEANKVTELENAEAAYDTLKVAADKEAAAAVVAKITAIGDVTFTYESRIAIEEARMAYNALSSDQKAKVTEAQLEVLKNAEAAYAEFAKTPVLADGDYYIVNAATGKYLNSGNSYGTQATASNYGQLVTVAYNASSKKYTIDTHYYNNNSKHFVSGGYMDSPVEELSIEKVNDGSFCIVDTAGKLLTAPTEGKSTIVTLQAEKSEGSGWLFLTRSQLIDKLSNEAPIEATTLIMDPGFAKFNTTYFKNWKTAGTTDGEFKEGVYSNDPVYLRCYQLYGTVTDFYQEIKGVPNGVYELSVQGFYREDGSGTPAVYYINGTEGNLKTVYDDESDEKRDGWTKEHNGKYVPDDPAQAARCFDEGAYTNAFIRAEVTDGNLRIGIKTKETGKWVCWDNFTLRLVVSDKKEAAAVVALIDKIGDPENVTLQSRSVIDAAKEAYDALSAAQQALVTNYSNLEAAKSKYDKLAAAGGQEAVDRADAEAVDNLIDAIGDPENVTLESKTAIETARAEYNKLGDAQKYVTKLEQLEAAETKLKSLEAAEEQKAADEVIAKITAIEDAASTLEKRIAIKKARAAYDALTETQQGKVTNDDELTAAEEAEELPADSQSLGDYYIVNNATGGLLNGGNNWGTQASTLNYGQLMTFSVVNVENDTYNIDSHINNGGDSHFVADGYVDGAATSLKITKGESGSFTISAGSKYLTASDENTIATYENEESDLSKWSILTREEFIEKAVASITADKGADLTSLILDSGFGRNNQYFSSWSGDKVDKTGSTANEGTDKDFHAEKKNVAFDSYQEIANVPNGVYELSVQGFYSAGADAAPAVYYINGAEGTLMTIEDDGKESSTGGWTTQKGNVYVPNTSTDTTRCFSAGGYANEPITVTVTNNKLKVGVKTTDANSWVAWDNFKLTLKKVMTDKEIADEVVALITAIGTVTADSKDAIKAAQDAYEALTEAQKDLVPDEKLEELEAKADEYEDITADPAVVAELKGQVTTAIAEAQADALVEEAYTEESWKAYDDALKALQTLAQKDDARKSELEKALEAFKDASDELEVKEEFKPATEDTEALETAVTGAAALKEADYVQDENWTAFKAALEKAQAIQSKTNATKAQVQAVTEALKTAKANLTPVVTVDKTLLDKAIKDYEGLKAADYTTATWTEFQKALNDAKAVYGNADATQDEVNTALETLKVKKAALKAAAATSNPVKVKTITITADYSKVAPGKKATLTAKVKPDNAKNKAVTWSIDAKSQKGKYATINSKTGVLTTNKKGAGKTVTVTATAQDGSGAKKTIKIKIMKGGVKKISLKAKSKKVKVKKKLTIKATVTTTTKKKSDANTKLVWKTSNKNVATVSSKGVVTGKKAGKVTITATATDGTKKSAKIKLTVVKK